ncbi:MAG: methyl-accepting chemotaxis protein [bacterium]
MAFFSLSAPIQGRSAPSLHQRFLVISGVVGAVIVVLLASGANALLSRITETRGDARVAEAASRALLVVTSALEDRVREARVLAMSPEIVSAAKEGGARARALGIVGTSIAELEKRFDDTRSLDVSPTTRTYLRELLPELEVAEILLTEANGYNAVTTQRSSDFVQSDEAWWQAADRDGLSPADAAFDSSARQTTVSLAAVVRDGSAKAGVIKMGFSAAPLVASLASAGGGVRIDVLDSLDRILLSSDSSQTGRALHGMPGGRGDTSAVTITRDGANERVVALRVNSARWRVVAHLPSEDIAQPFEMARIAIVGGAVALIIVLLVLLVSLNQFLQKRITTPARELAEAAEAVAAGDFSVQLRHTAADDEVGRLSRAVGAMILELNRLAQAIAGSARETSAMSSEITAGSEQMAATAGQIANTASDLSGQATTMAETISSLASSAHALQELATMLDGGAREGVQRNTALRSLAMENRAGLDASAGALSSLAVNVQESAEAIEALGAASEEIRSFVTLVRKLARQSKLLALNAAMEAARAGVHGQGFGVVASEVRRLAAMSSDAADQTEAIVKSVLQGISTSRASADRAVGTAAEVRSATSLASSSFTEIERAVAESEAWTATIAHASTATTSLVAEVTERLHSLAGGTESFAAAMQQVAASSEEQSASTEEIAGAANALGSAAERLSKLVGGLRTG